MKYAILDWKSNRKEMRDSVARVSLRQYEDLSSDFQLPC